jgi:hypothetical protein
MNTYKRHRFPPDIISYAVWLARSGVDQGMFKKREDVVQDGE